MYRYITINVNPIIKVTPFDGTSFNDLELPLCQISKSRYYPTSSNSQMAQDRTIVTIAD